METSANVVNGGDYEASREEATQALTKRLTDFRAWCQEEAGITVHPSVCIVNGDATDGTKYAPVLTLGAPSPETEPRLGSIEGVGHESLYARTMGCQVRAVREMKKGDTVFTMPRGAMITPDTIASSDAGKAVLACCESLEGNSGFWDSFGNTRELEQAFGPKINCNCAPPLRLILGPSNCAPPLRLIPLAIHASWNRHLGLRSTAMVEHSYLSKFCKSASAPKLLWQIERVQVLPIIILRLPLNCAKQQRSPQGRPFWPF